MMDSSRIKTVDRFITFMTEVCCLPEDAVTQTGNRRLIKRTIWRKVMSSGKIFTGSGL